MPQMNVRTKGNASPARKPRVYFTCHPADFDKYFDKICEDIFKSHDCAIYYTEDMTEPFDEADLVTDLESNNLFVIPVTFKLLTQPNRAMDQDFAYAKEKCIPVLPLMMESGIDSIYQRPDKFGERQYISPYSSDLTEVRYEEKLKKYLEVVLISDEMAKRVRAAFDAYIFLSYRKKDRRYANELMRLIHKKPQCRDIAIWYDEFLTPGESFKENIARILKDSKLFALLVTPNLLEEPDGKPNFVMAEEYPEAKKAGMPILPAEMEATNQEALSTKFDGIPRCVNPYAEGFNEQILESLALLATEKNDSEPEHNFLIGLAYLEGIDVETNRELGLSLITAAAEAELPEAMEKLYEMYYNGTYVALDYQQALIWIQKLSDYYLTHFGEEDPKTLAARNDLAVTYYDLGDYQTALELQEKVYALRCKILGEEHPNTLRSLGNLAVTYGELGNRQKSLELNEKVYALRCKILGEEHPNTLTSLNNLAFTYGELGNHQKALELNEKVYTLLCKILGEEHPDTLTALSNLACIHFHLEQYQKAYLLFQKVYAGQCKVLGKDHPHTENTLSNILFLEENFLN